MLCETGTESREPEYLNSRRADGKALASDFMPEHLRGSDIEPMMLIPQDLFGVAVQPPK
jgi:hypothetical protein